MNHGPSVSRLICVGGHEPARRRWAVREHWLHLGVLRIERARPELRRDVWLVVDQAVGAYVGHLDAGRPLSPVSASSALAPEFVADTTSPPLDLTPTGEPNSAKSSRQTSGVEGRSSRHPSSLSETSRFPSQALVVPPAIWRRVRRPGPADRSGRRSKRTPRRSPPARDRLRSVDHGPPPWFAQHHGRAWVTGTAQYIARSKRPVGPPASLL